MGLRRFWMDTMLLNAKPVLVPLSKGKLHEKLPTDFHPERAIYAPLEAFGRVMCGMAPWLEAEIYDEEEREEQKRFISISKKCIANAVDPESPDRMNFSEGYGQSLVDAAFLAQGILRAPNVLWYGLDKRTRRDLASALRSTRKFTPYESNWLLFPAMIETLLRHVGEDYDTAPIDRALDAFAGWYVGDGLYSDGRDFHVDYYNSYVIHPMLVDILYELRGEDRYALAYELELGRAKRCAALLERLIMSDGSYPVLGRSSTYRYGAFHLLSQAALRGFLPDDVFPSAVRSALTAVICRVHSGRIFDKEGFLNPGVAGDQPRLAESYISTGSLYMLQTLFLPMGLPASHSFWSDYERPWTQRRIWMGADVIYDRPME